MFDHIAIVGVGLIGGSFALAARRARLARRITGWGNSAASLERACRDGVIDDIETPFESGGASDACLVYLSAPVGAIIDFLRMRARSIKPGAIVTDAGSTKREICRAACEHLPESVRFVGGHPMAGSHKSGAEFASADLFQGAPYALMTDERTGCEKHGEALELMIEVVEAIGSRPVMITPERHDRAVARISHLPQLLSTALTVAIAKGSSSEEQELAGQGFAEMTRLAQSHWSVWEDICRTNADEIASALADLGEFIEDTRIALEWKNASELRDAFQLANEFLRAFHQAKR